MSKVNIQFLAVLKSNIPLLKKSNLSHCFLVLKMAHAGKQSGEPVQQKGHEYGVRMWGHEAAHHHLAAPDRVIWILSLISKTDC